MKKTQSKPSKKSLKVKDLTPKNSKAKSVKGGLVGPNCRRTR
jgi:hypothetical protein